jgi:hypothetical protein
LLTGDEYAGLASAAARSSSRRARDWQRSRQHYEKALAGFRQISGAWFEAAIGAKQAAEKIRECDAALAGSGSHAELSARSR